MERVRCITNDNVNLIGFLYGNNNNECWNLIFPGVDGNIITNEFINEMGIIFSKNNQKLLCCHHRGSFQIYSSNPLRSTEIGKTIGSAFEKFDDCIYDIESWIKYALDNGAKKVNLLAHSHGCNKLIYYLSQDKKYDKYIDKLIFLSPLDLYTRMNNRRDVEELYKKAKIDESKGELDNFICCGFFYKNISSFYDMMENSNINNFPMMSLTNNDFSVFNSIKKEKYIIYGGDETKYINNFDIKKKYLDENVKDIITIESASHIYQGKEKELSNCVLDILRGKGMNNFIDAGIRITRNCNLKCPYCNIQAVKKDDLTIDEWKKAGKIIKNLGIRNLVILGGEPTEYKKLNEFVKYYEKDLDIRCSMTTNAYNNFEQIKEVIDSGLSKIGVSVDNLNIKDSISPFKDKMGLEMIKQLIDYKDNINIVDYAVLSKKNINSIIDLIKYMSNLNISVYILPFHHSNEGEYEHRKDNQSNAFITDDDLDNYNKVIDEIIQMKKDGYLIANSTKYLNLTKKYIKKLNWKCSGLSELRIDSDGKMVCCCDLIGEVNKKYSIFDLEDKEKLDKFIIDRNNDSNNCKGCLWPSSLEAEIKRENEDNIKCLSKQKI